MTRIALAAALLALAAPAAMAEQPRQEIQIPVSQTDLNDRAELARIEARIAEAAVQVCRHQANGDPLRAYTLRSCIEATTADAMAQLYSHRDVATLSTASNQVAVKQR